MNKRIALLGLVLLAVPACGGKRNAGRMRPTYVTETVVEPGSQEFTISEQPMYDGDSKPSNDIEGFAFEESGRSFMPPASTADDIATVDVVDEAWVDKRLGAVQEDGFRPVYFSFGEYALRPDQKAVLDANLRKITGLVRKGAVIVIEGHACRFAGSALYNMHLSEQRAESVAQYFVQQGIDRDKIKVVGRGYEMCLVPEGDMEQQAPNRRVEFYVLKDQQLSRASAEASEQAAEQPSEGAADQLTADQLAEQFLAEQILGEELSGAAEPADQPGEEDEFFEEGVLA